MDDTLRDFKINRLNLPKEKRKEVEEIKNKLEELGVAFMSNINSYKDELLVTEAEIKGLPEDYKTLLETKRQKTNTDADSRYL